VAGWLILVHRIPSRPLYLRAKMRQRLAAAGAVAVKNSVYLLPRGSETREDLEWIAQEIVAGGGDAHLFEGEFVDPMATAAAVAQFRQARAAEYRELTEESRATARDTNRPSRSPDLAVAHQRLAQRLQRIRRLDFFEADGRLQAEQALAAIVSRLRRGEKQEKPMRTVEAGLKGRTWVTRPGIKVDRIASAWFIRRFIDSKARFRFQDPGSPKRKGELRFDMVGGDFTHEGDRCTLETLVARIGLPDAGVRALAEIVHDIDLKDSKFGRAETAGVAAALDGLVRRNASDPARLEQGFALFDDLHEALGRTRKAPK
jgi:hypothetical protein